jgi:ATP-dependent DNA ligase
LTEQTLTAWARCVNGSNVRVYSRNGAAFKKRFPRLVKAAQGLQVVSALIDGECIVYDREGMPDFALIHRKEYDPDYRLWRST